jgi:hypothetical protein
MRMRADNLLVLVVALLDRPEAAAHRIPCDSQHCMHACACMRADYLLVVAVALVALDSSKLLRSTVHACK